ncbi:hypothetical protein [Planococcus beigongshangi]|uniref:hypothetical protein n=1 Tax=Planococcus beigongshangi TaxID=2782536 RepID=UPI00193C35D3|nr:hypothetical protein [Planococcus beigongshangi]
MERKFVYALIILFASILCTFPIQALAEADITIDAEAGFQNKVKADKGVPIRITATNNGKAFTGDLVLDYSESYSIGSGVSVPLDLAAGETKTIQLSMPGLMDNVYAGGPNTQTIFLYEGGWEEGQATDFKGRKSLQPNYFSQDTLFIGVLTDNADRLRVLNELLSSGTGPGSELFFFNQDDQLSLPADVLALDSLDYLIIDEYPFSDLPAASQAAVENWVLQGGNLIIGAVGNMEAAAGNLAPLLPLDLSNPADKSVPGFENPFAVYGATLKEGAQPVLIEQDQIFAAQNAVGSGSIIQTAFSIGDEPVVSQEGYGAFLLSLMDSQQVPMPNYQGESIKQRISYEIGTANELFESFAVSRTAMFLIILVYLILTVPVLYLFLKKKDKRELAWLAIPAFAVLASIGIFAAGAKDRIGNPQIQQTGFFEVDRDGGLNGYYMNTLLSNRGGDYKFTAPSTTTMSATAGNQFAGGNTHNNAILEKSVEHSALTVRDMRYWSVASIIGESYIKESGAFDIQLMVEDDVLKGTVRNDFPFAVHDAAIWSGTRLIALGDLAPGEEVQVSEQLQTDFLPSISPIGQMMAGQQPLANQEDLIEERKQSALRMAHEHLSRNGSLPYVIAYTNDAIIPVQLDNQDAKVSAVHLLAESFEPDVDFAGDLSLNSENFNVEITTASAQGYFHEYPDTPGFIGLETGEYLIEYQLPAALREADADWSEFNVSTMASDVSYSILSGASGEYEELPNGSGESLDNGTDYISEDGTIEIMLKVDSRTGYAEINLPKIELKGVAGP